MGAYLVGSRGTALHAVALGLAVTVSHTLGIILLAAVILQVADVAPELFNTVAPIVSGLTVLAIGAWLLLGKARAYRARQAGRAARDHGHAHDLRRPQAHTHPGDDGLDHRHGHEHVAPPDAPIGWRSLFVLGLAGGLIPSTNALIILLAAINVDRPGRGRPRPRLHPGSDRPACRRRPASAAWHRSFPSGRPA